MSREKKLSFFIIKIKGMKLKLKKVKKPVSVSFTLNCCCCVRIKFHNLKNTFVPAIELNLISFEKPFITKCKFLKIYSSTWSSLFTLTKILLSKSFRVLATNWDEIIERRDENQLRDGKALA